MGSSLGAALMHAGHETFWSKAGRSAASSRRADEDGLQPVETLDELVRIVEMIVSICPPHKALQQAEAVVEAGFDGVYVDANAVAPETVRAIESVVSAEADFVDGGVIGPPAREAGITLLCVSGTG